GLEQPRLQLRRDEQQVGGEDRDGLPRSAQQQRVQLERVGDAAAGATALRVARQRRRAVRCDVDRPGGDESAALASLSYSRLLYTSAVCSAVRCHVNVRARARPRSIKSSRSTASPFRRPPTCSRYASASLRSRATVLITRGTFLRSTVLPTCSTTKASSGMRQSARPRTRALGASEKNARSTPNGTTLMRRSSPSQVASSRFNHSVPTMYAPARRRALRVPRRNRLRTPSRQPSVG